MFATIDLSLAKITISLVIVSRSTLRRQEKPCLKCFIRESLWFIKSWKTCVKNVSIASAQHLFIFFQVFLERCFSLRRLDNLAEQQITEKTVLPICGPVSQLVGRLKQINLRARCASFENKEFLEKHKKYSRHTVQKKSQILINYKKIKIWTNANSSYQKFAKQIKKSKCLKFTFPKNQCT